VTKKNALPEKVAAGLRPAAAHPHTHSLRKKEVCAFFATGNCRYGARCMNIHTLGGDGDEDYVDVRTQVQGQQGLSGQEDVVAAECGICYGRPTDGVYGILSHCDCIFCLSCIRQWRTQHGKEIASSGQVRLCPLCRVESYFTVPSLVALRHGDKKDLLIQNYRLSLKKIPCKFAGQVCPFGSSCFYFHPESDRAAVHHLLNSAGEVEVRGEGLDLFSFVKTKLKR